MGKVRVLVCEDSLTIRKRLVEVLANAPDIEVVGEAADGKKAIELCEALRPDVMTVDMMMPVMSGLAVTEYVMAYCPTPILIVSASLNRGQVFKTFEALAAGAVDVLDKPSGDEDNDAWEQRFISTVKLVSRIKVITHPRARLAPHGARSSPVPLPLSNLKAGQPTLVAIGASTGGPNAVLEILRGLPGDYRLPILLVVHIGQPFGDSFASWLNEQSPLPVRHAEDGELIPTPGQGQVLMARPDRHLIARGGRLWLTDDPERHSCRPSVDVLFESLAKELGSQAVACLLTGMGRDGAEGLLAMRNAGATTFAQDEATSTVYGMPRAAKLLGAASDILPLAQFAPALRRIASSPQGDSQ